jgi:transposase
MLEKKKSLRKIEFTFTDGEVHDYAHAEYITEVIEDGVAIATHKDRNVLKLDEAKESLSKTKVRQELK